MDETRLQLIPDGTGSICLSGEEKLADAFLTKNSFLERLTEEVDKLKAELRSAAQAAVARARSAGGGVVQRVLVSASRGGVGVSLPDYLKPGNRPVFSDEKLGELMKAGGLEAVGLKPEEVFEEECDPGGEVVTLRGRWAAWFASSYAAHIAAKDPDICWEKRAPSAVRRLRAEVIGRLEDLAAHGSAAAGVLLARGLRAMMVRGEQG